MCQPHPNKNWPSCLPYLLFRYHFIIFCVTITYCQGSDARVCTMYPKKPCWFFWVHPPKNPHFCFNLILVYTLYATNYAIFYCFIVYKLSYRVFVLLYLFSCLSKKPTGLGFFLKPGFFLNPAYCLFHFGFAV